VVIPTFRRDPRGGFSPSQGGSHAVDQVHSALAIVTVALSACGKFK